MDTKYIPKHPAALYINELSPMQDGSERCVLFGHFYHPPDPDVTLTRVVAALPDNNWGVVNDIDVNDVISSASYFEKDSKRQLFAVFRFGETFIYQGTARTAVPKPPGVGFISGVKKIENYIYACGSQNTIYRFDGKKWIDEALNLRVKYTGHGDPILNAIDGFSESDIYAVGYNGSIVHFDGSNWKSLKSPRDEHLHQVLCHTDGKVYACGRSGVVLRGDVDGWEDLASSDRKDDFWGLTSFDEKVFLCTFEQLFQLVDCEMIEVKVSVNSAGSFYRLASNQSYMWATTGTGRILRFDKTSWIEMIWPDSI